MSDTFIWQGRELRTLGDVMDAVASIRDRDEAQAFLGAYRLTNEYAVENIGYLTGYFGREDGQRVLELFGTPHPIFGATLPSPEVAFAAGAAR